MAGCHHDNQIFKSDLNIEVAIKYNILKKGQDLKNIECDKNKGHQDFIPFKDLTLEHLPIEYRNKEILNEIENIGKTVVRLVIGEKGGTGFVVQYEDKYFIKTNNHVVKTDDELKNCTVEFHYDDYSRSSVLYSTGVKLVETCPYRDISLFTFDPIPLFLHQLDWLDNFSGPSLTLMYNNNHMETLKTFPYRRSIRSQLSLFISNIDLNDSQIKNMRISHHNDSYSYLKSFYFKFQPIPSNIQQLTNIIVYKHGDEGNSRVISGSVEKFGDEFVVKLSESISQDEVKKCRLVLNGEVIGRGTRLYFKPVKSGDLFSGIELKMHIEKGRENFWIFECHPPPKYIEDILKREPSSNDVCCCIGHPHGLSKKVKFGRLLGKSLQRFDNQYRRITNPKPDCHCKEVTCMNYSCKTCSGSSGSPVFLLRTLRMMDYCFCHFLGKTEQRKLPTGELIIENINMAWCSNTPS